MIKWTWNDVELEIDMDDYEFQVKYEEAFKYMEVKEEEIKKTGDLSGITKSYCEMFFDLFNRIFGDGTSDKLFGEKINARIVDECYELFIINCKKEVDVINKRRSQMTSKYKVKTRK